MDSRADGGLGLSLQQIGAIYGTAAPVMLLAGGILGGIFISKVGLRRALFIMAFALNVPNLIYIYLASELPESLFVTGSLIAVEQFGYGFGFAGYMVYLMHASRGKNRTSSYAICTSLMALGISFPGLFSGALQMRLGYLGFFEWVVIATSVSFAVTWLAWRSVKKASE